MSKHVEPVFFIVPHYCERQMKVSLSGVEANYIELGFYMYFNSNGKAETEN